jgi:hypothetical protein
MKTIDVCMIAWPRDFHRLTYMEMTLRSFRQNLSAAGYSLRYYVSLETLDVSTEHFKQARQICAAYEAEPHWRAQPPSLGGNTNDALMLGHGEFKLFTQDDWVWKTPRDLATDCAVLERNPEYAMIRYATFYTKFIGNDLCRIGGPKIIDGRSETTQDGISGEFEVYNIVKMDEPYAYGDQPHLRRADFAVKKSATGGEPIGFYVRSETGDYASPEHRMAAHLEREGWKILATQTNQTDHCGSLSSCPLRRNAV